MAYKEETSFLGLKRTTRYGKIENGKLKKDRSLFDSVTNSVGGLASSFVKLGKFSNPSDTSNTNHSDNPVNSSNDLILDYSYNSTHAGRCKQITNEIEKVKKYNNGYLFAVVFVIVAAIIGAFAIYKKKNVSETLPEYKLYYYASEGGCVMLKGGDTKYTSYIRNTVKEGDNSWVIVAIPNDGYTFVCWNDGITTATRQDCNITQPFEVTAYFELIE